jgi:hypothetical protein
MRKDEVRTSDTFTKYMQYTNSTDCGKYILYEFTDESGNVGLHYQLNPELIEDKKAKGMARLWQTKVSKLNVGDIAIVVCKAKEIHEEQYANSVFYLNVEKIIKRLVKYETVDRLYNSVMMEFAVEVPIREWDDIRR